MKVRKSIAAAGIAAAVALTGAGAGVAAMATAASASSDNCAEWQAQLDKLQEEVQAGQTGFPLPGVGGFRPGNGGFSWFDRLIDNVEIAYYKLLLKTADCPAPIMGSGGGPSSSPSPTGIA